MFLIKNSASEQRWEAESVLFPGNQGNVKAGSVVRSSRLACLSCMLPPRFKSEGRLELQTAKKKLGPSKWGLSKL